jgi:hypothetical protein
MNCSIAHQQCGNIEIAPPPLRTHNNKGILVKPLAAHQKVMFEHIARQYIGVSLLSVYHADISQRKVP